VVYRTRREYIYPATHFASSTAAGQTNVPAMGQRLRLKAGFPIPASWTRQEKAILDALKKYGAIVADNGNFFSISVTPDDRWPVSAFDHLSSVGITNFEVVRTTGPNEGPRSPGGPQANAGADRRVLLGAATTLEGFVSYTGAPPIVQWRLYSGPGLATFGNTAQTNTTVSLSAPGTYTLLLGASDGIHADSYDAVVLIAGDPITMTAAVMGPEVQLAWSGGAPPFLLERSDTLHPGSWSPILTTDSRNACLPIHGAGAFFRVRMQ